MRRREAPPERRDGAPGLSTPQAGLLTSHVAKLGEELRERGISFPVPLDRELSAWKDYCIGALPTTVILDREGIVRFAEPNFYWASREKIEEVLRGLGVGLP